MMPVAMTGSPMYLRRCGHSCQCPVPLDLETRLGLAVAVSWRLATGCPAAALFYGRREGRSHTHMYHLAHSCSGYDSASQS